MATRPLDLVYDSRHSIDWCLSHLLDLFLDSQRSKTTRRRKHWRWCQPWPFGYYTLDIHYRLWPRLYRCIGLHPGTTRTDFDQPSHSSQAGRFSIGSLFDPCPSLTTRSAADLESQLTMSLLVGASLSASLSHYREQANVVFSDSSAAMHGGLSDTSHTHYRSSLLRVIVSTGVSVSFRNYCKATIRHQC